VNRRRNKVGNRRRKDMMAKLYYQKNPNFNMTREDAARLTLAKLVNNYERVLEIEVPEGTLPDRIFSMYQDRPIPLPADIKHTSMSVGDIVVLGKKMCVCCRTGWYTLELSNIQLEPTIEAS